MAALSHLETKQRDATAFTEEHCDLPSYVRAPILHACMYHTDGRARTRATRHAIIYSRRKDSMYDVSAQLCIAILGEHRYLFSYIRAPN